MLARITAEEEYRQELKHLPKFHDLWHALDESCSDVIANYQASMKQAYRQKKSVIDFCVKIMRKEELDAEKRSIELIRALEGQKKHKLRAIEEAEDKNLASEDFEDSMMKAVDQLEDDLMEIEMRLQYALQDALEVYKDRIKKIQAEMKEQTEKFIKVIDTNTQEFCSDLSIHALQEFALYTEQYDQQQEAADDNEDEEEDKLADLFFDKETVDTALEQSKDFMQKRVTGMEGQIEVAIRKEQLEIDSGITKGQHERNRGIVREIIATC
jgi:hypothetical protein